MNKKANTAVFILAATAFNLVLMIGMLIGSLAILAALSQDSELSQNMLSVIMFLLFSASIVVSFLLYGLVMKWLQRKYNIQDKLHPIFGRRRRNP